MTDEERLDQAELVEEVSFETATTTKQRAKLGPFRRLYRGLTTFDFVGRKRVWFTISPRLWRPRGFRAAVEGSLRPVGGDHMGWRAMRVVRF